MEVAEYKGSIKKRLVSIIIFVTVITGAIGYGSFVVSYMDIEYKKSLVLAKTVGDILSQNIAKIVLLNDVSAAADISSQLKSFTTLQSMVLYKKDTKAIFQYSKDNKNFKPRKLPKNVENLQIVDENRLTLYIRAIYQETHLGYVELEFEVDTIYDILKRDIKQLITIFFLVSILSLYLATYFAKLFTEPILKLVKFLESVEFLDSLKSRVYTNENNEYGKLYEEVNTMLDRMESAKEYLKIAAVAVETQSGMTITDANQKILRINRAFTDITGYSQSESIGQTPSILNSGMQDDDFYQNMHNSLQKYHHWSGEIHNKHKDGTIYPEFLTIQAVVDENSEIIYYVASFIDLSIQKASEEKVQYLSQYDTLTGLVNRKIFIQNMNQDFKTGRKKGWASVICFNIKDFKTINDAYGHTNGDLLLQEIASRVKLEFQESSLIGRTGSDEFAIWFDTLNKNKNKASLEAKDLAEHLIRVLAEPFAINGVVININVYAGISLYNEEANDAQKVLKHSSVALNISKKEDKIISFFDKEAESLALEHLGIYRELIEAIKDKEFELYYQLQYDNNFQIYGAEALIRWTHRDGIISPLEFIPIAEKTGLILPIGLWVIEASCKQLAVWQNRSETKNWVMAINISAKQFIQDDFLDSMKSAIEKNSIDTSGLKLELTESVLVDNLDLVIQKMQQLHEIGIKISLDDFGTGYSSLQYLKNLPLDQVKIDQSFVHNILQNDGDIAIIKSVILLGEALNFEVLAEGVETKEHYDLLKKLGCKLFQGYYFAYPKKIDDIKV